MLLLVSCSKDQGKKNTLPTKFTIDIPDNLSSNSSRGSRADSIDGAGTYELLRVFVKVAEDAAEIVEGISYSLHAYRIDTVLEFTYSGDDGRRKELRVSQEVLYDNQQWDLELTITDKDDALIGMQVFWNRGGGEGIALLKPSIINYEDHKDKPNAIYKIDYTEFSEDYDARMIVSITTDNITDQWGIDKMKLFVGRVDDVFELFGNSNLPNAGNLFSDYPNGGSYAFVARSNESKDIAVAKVAIAPSQLSSNEEIFQNYNIKEVIINEIINDAHANGSIDTAQIDAGSLEEMIFNWEGLIVNSDLPAYFNSRDGFMRSGQRNRPSGFTSEFIDLNSLQPYAPLEISQMTISFK